MINTHKKKKTAKREYTHSLDKYAAQKQCVSVALTTAMTLQLQLLLNAPEEKIPKPNSIDSKIIFKIYQYFSSTSLNWEYQQHCVKFSSTVPWSRLPVYYTCVHLPCPVSGLSVYYTSVHLPCPVSGFPVYYTSVQNTINDSYVQCLDYLCTIPVYTSPAQCLDYVLYTIPVYTSHVKCLDYLYSFYYTNVYLPWPVSGLPVYYTSVHWWNVVTIQHEIL